MHVFLFRKNILQVKCRFQTYTLQNWRVLEDHTFCQAHSLSLIMQVTNGVSVRGKLRLSIQKGKTIIWTVEMCWAMKLASLGDVDEEKILKYQRAAARQGAAGIWALRPAPRVCSWSDWTRGCARSPARQDHLQSRSRGETGGLSPSEPSCTF